MNGSSILKKVLPVIAAIVLIIVIAIVVSAVKTGGEFAPSVSDAEKDYVKVSDKVSISREEMYEELKNGIGLSTIINMANKSILKEKTNKDNVSFYDAVSNDDIDKEIEIATYGEDADLEALSAEDKTKKENDFKNTMLTGYGYKTDEEIRNHYRLVLAKEAYARSVLAEEVDNEDSDQYIKKETISDKYESNYKKSYYAFIIPFVSEEQAKLALQQLRIAGSNKKFINITLEKAEGSSYYETKNGNTLLTSEVFDAFINLYNLVYGYKGEEYKLGTYEVNGNVVTVKDGEYAIASCLDKVNALSAIVEEAHALIAADPMDKEGAKAKLTEAKNIIKEISDMVVFGDGVKVINANMEALEKSLDSDATASDPLKDVDTLISSIKAFDSRKYLFNTNDTESKLYHAYADLNAYDSNLPSQFNNNYSDYIPFSYDDKTATINETDTSENKWYSATVVTGTNVKYLILKIKEVAAQSYDDVKQEIKDTLIDEKLTSDYVESKMAKLREEYEFKIFDSTLEKKYIDAISEYTDVKYNKTKKAGELVFSCKGLEVSADALFKEMDYTSGVATLLSELSYRRLVNDTTFNKYYDAETGKWLGDEGKELRDNIVTSLENQRLYFLAGAYTQYGYDPTTMTWDEFIAANGAKDEKDLAFLNLYSEVSADYMEEAIKALLVEGKEAEIKYMVESLADAEGSEVWTLLQERMNAVLAKKFTVKGIHLLVSVYETVNDFAGSKSSDSKVSPLDPKKWTDAQRTAAVALINDAKAYLDAAEGTYADKLQAVVTAFEAAPYAYKDASNEYVKVINSSNEEYQYVLKAGEVSIDLSYYKSLGLSVKYESLGSFTEGKMVENFNDAAKSIWDKDIADKEYNRITVYNEKDLDTVYGYHLYVNLGSTANAEYEAQKDENTTVTSTLPTLFEIRTNALLTALKAVDQTTLSEEDAKKVQDQIDELTALLSTEATTAITAYSADIVSQLSGSTYASLSQQSDLMALLNGLTLNSPAGLTFADIEKIVEANKESVYENTLTLLVNGDEKFNAKVNEKNK